MPALCFIQICVGDAHLLCKRVSPSGLTASPPFPVQGKLCSLPESHSPLNYNPVIQSKPLVCEESHHHTIRVYMRFLAFTSE